MLTGGDEWGEAVAPRATGDRQSAKLYSALPPAAVLTWAVAGKRPAHSSCTSSWPGGCRHGCAGADLGALRGAKFHQRTRFRTWAVKGLWDRLWLSQNRQCHIVCCVLLLLHRPGLLLLPGCCPGAVLAGIAEIILLRGRRRAVSELSKWVHPGAVVLQNAGICCLGRVLLAGLRLKLLSKMCKTGTQAQLAKKRQKKQSNRLMSGLILVVAATRAANHQQRRCIV